ncbi:terminase small subunit [Neglecta sp. X4]|nr:terminase small subunit [Neglectibacter sp. 59]NBJ74228.1 terminase small subunit [Neglectibacter sp. X4]NCE81736.1 terminase small subunit [Neglectibacter sp. X58]
MRQGKPGRIFNLCFKKVVNTLTPRQQKFCDEYLISGNATDAAIKAGYSPKTAKNIGSENLAKPDLKAYIEAQLAALHSEKIADATEVLEYLTSVMRGKHTEEVPLLCGDGVQTLTPKEVGAKERLKAAELIGKRFGLFTDRVGIDGAVPIVIHDDIPDD